MKKKFSKEMLTRQKFDYERHLRVVKYIDYPFVLQDSPVELEEGYIVSDRQSCEIFASFIFKNVCERPIRALNIRLACYQNQNIPYLNIDFTYSSEKLTFGIISKNGEDMKLRDANMRTFINQSESFGSCVLIPIPESYFKRLEVIITSVQYVSGDIEELNLLVAGESKRYHELDHDSKIVYSRVNIYQAAEERFPTTVIPQFGNQVWLCCCGNKNPDSSSVCEKCGREKEWLKKSVSEEVLEDTKLKMISDPQERVLHDKSKFSQNRFMENKADIQKKIEQYEKAMENLAREERIKERNRNMVIPKILIWIAGVLILADLISLLMGTGVIANIINLIKRIYDVIINS